MIKIPATPGGLGGPGGTGRGRRHAQRHADLLATAIHRRPRRRLARGPAAQRPRARSSRSTASSSAGWTSTPSSTCRSCPPAAQGMVGIVNAKRIWKMNQRFWADKKLPLKQEMIFASTGTKKPDRPAVEVRRGVRRLRHRDQSAGDQRRRRGERPDLHAPDRPDAARRGAGRDRTAGGHARRWKTR